MSPPFYSRIDIARFIPVLVLSIATLSGVAFGQESYRVRKAEFFQAVKFSEFGELSRALWEKELDRFAEAGKAYVSAQLYVIVYAQAGSPRTSVDSIEKQYKEFLEKRVDESVSVYAYPGGYRKQLTTELWVVSKHDDQSPKSTPDELFKPEKFDEVGEVSDEEFLKVFEAFTKKSSSEPRFQGYIVNYGTPEEIARREKLIVESVNFGPHHDRSRLTLVNGGSRSSPLTAFWHVPPAASLPPI
jgi:hypothetical protein